MADTGVGVDGFLGIAKFLSENKWMQFREFQPIPLDLQTPASVADGSSKIRDGIDASRQSRITLRSIRATHLKIGKNRILANSAAVNDFRLRAHHVSKPLRSNVSRQQSRYFNDLQGHCVPHSSAAFDIRRRILLKRKILLTKGRLPEACREVERVRCSRADLQSAPGRLGYQSPGIMTGMGGAPWTGTGEGG